MKARAQVIDMARMYAIDMACILEMRGNSSSILPMLLQPTAPSLNPHHPSTSTRGAESSVPLCPEARPVPPATS